MGVVRFIEEKSIRKKVSLAFLDHQKFLKGLIPYAELTHIGSTAVEGSLTKGDLDILVEVPKERFNEADLLLAKYFERNLESERSDKFSSFKNDELDPPLGLQVCAGKENMGFRQLLFRMKTDPEFLTAYNALKKFYEGKSEEEYWEAKSKFIKDFLG